MTNEQNNITSITVENELKQSYISYAMSVIVGRALPDVRDGLKPVHRRVLYAMYILNNDYNKPYKKSARVVGDVIGKYHPHGDTAVYDAIVRMAQYFSMRYMLIDGQGNFGSVDGDAPAAMRYTEIRMQRLAHEILADLDKNTVDFCPNYDGSEKMPEVMPTKIPNLLINGSSGIAVGMATNIPPHNLNEICDACLLLVENSESTIEDLMDVVSGPDFPTAGIINGRAGIYSAYRTGRGKIYLRARTKIEVDKAGKESIIIEELPFQVNKARLLEKMALLVKEKKIEGITALRDESDKQGMRAVIEVRRGENSEVLLNNLYYLTQLQTVFGINMVVLDNGQPKCMNLREILVCFVEHRKEIVIKRTIYDLSKAKSRGHILEGLGVALINIDEIVALIKAAKNPAEAKEKLMSKIWPAGKIAELLKKSPDLCRPSDVPDSFGILATDEYKLTVIQAQAILELRLHRLTGLEQDKIFDEYNEIVDKIKDLKDILDRHERLMFEIKKEIVAIKEQYGDERKTEIIDLIDMDNEDLIPREDLVVTFSNLGYVKTQPQNTYQSQKRGGKGKSAANVKDEDFVQYLEVANSHDFLLCFSTLGKVYWLKVYKLPQASRAARGKPIVNFLPLAEGETISAVMAVSEFNEDLSVFMATERGTVKKVSLESFSRPRSNGVIAIALDDGDKLISAAMTSGSQDVMLFSDAGKVIRFPEDKVRTMGRQARGVRGIKLADENKVISLVIVAENSPILTATEKGYGKRTSIEDYRITGRGGQGVISIQVNERNGKVIGALQAANDGEIFLISNKGTLVRTKVDEISLVGRNTQGVRLIRLANSEDLISMQALIDSDDGDEQDSCESEEKEVGVE
ncbi:MAG: DNA gyrase subunit A [Legionellales bacterium]|mgnify:CR=1 FL=1|jgi:DNA gyrase subunit A|nr:DNA gyrase subunit A [Legionellales bacterium]